MTEVGRTGQTAWHDWWPWIVFALGVAVVTVGGILFSP